LLGSRPRTWRGAVGLCDAPFITHEQKTLGSIGEVKQYFETMMVSVPPEQQPTSVIDLDPGQGQGCQGRRDRVTPE
jgi:hypothetical protein